MLLLSTRGDYCRLMHHLGSKEALFSGSTANVTVSGTTAFVWCTDLVYLLCDRNGSECRCYDSIQLLCEHKGSLCPMAFEYNDQSHLINLFQNGAKQTLGMLDVIVAFQNGTKQNALYAGCYCNVSGWWIWNQHTTSFLNFSLLELAQNTQNTHRTPNDSIRNHLIHQHN